MDVIQSAHNPKVQFARSLLDKKARYQNSLYIIEGYNILKDLPPNNGVKEFFVKESAYEKFLPFLTERDKPFYVLKDRVFETVSDTQNSGGLVAIATIPAPKPIAGDRVLILDGVRDAGNAGALVRTAAALGIYDVIAVCGADLYNPKAARAAMGGLFHCNTVQTDGYGEVKELVKGYRVAGLDMRGENVYLYAPPKKWAVAVGSEARGLSEEMRALCGDFLSVPMPSGKMESLNAAVSAGIALSAMVSGKGA